MIALLIAGIVGMTLMFWFGYLLGRKMTMDTAMDAARIVILKHESDVLAKLQEIAK